MRILLIRVLTVLFCVTACSVGLAGEPAAEERGVTGSVRDEAGRPLAGIIVRAWSEMHLAADYPGLPPSSSEVQRLFHPPALPSGMHEVRTDEAGRYQFGGVVRGHLAELQAVGTAPAMSGWSDPALLCLAGDEAVPLVIRAGRRLKGRVVDALGNGVQAWLSTHGREQSTTWGAEPGYSRQRIDRQIATDADGRFVIAAPAGGDMLMEALVPGVGRRGMRLVGPDEKEILIRMAPEKSTSLTGRVTDAHGKPFVGARVLAYFVRAGMPGAAPPLGPGVVNPGGGWPLVRANPDAAMTLTGPDGVYRLEHVPPGVLTRLLIQANGYPMEDAGALRVPLILGRPWKSDYVLSPGRTVRGRVLDEQGEPIVGAEIVAGPFGVTAQGRTVPIKTRTDIDGAYVLKHVTTGRASLRVSAEGYYWKLDVPEEARQHAGRGALLDAGRPGDVLDRDLVLYPAREVSAWLVDDAGSPVAGISANLSIRTASPSSYSSLSFRAVSGPDGHLVFRGLPPVPAIHFAVFISAYGFAMLSHTIDADALSEGEPVRLVLQRGCLVRGRVLDSQGMPVAGIGVRCDRGNHLPTTDRDGCFEIVGVPPGRRRVRLGSQAVETTSVFVEASPEKPARGVELRLASSGVLAGTVVDGAGRPLGGVPLAVTPSGKPYPTKRLLTDSAGRFLVTHLPKGSFTIHVQAGRQLSITAETGRTDLRFVLESLTPRILEGRVVDEDGQLVPHAQVRVGFAADPPGMTRAESPLLAGRFRVALPPGSERAWVRIENARTAPAGEEVFLPRRMDNVELDGKPLEIRLERLKGIEGTVLDEHGKPVPGYRLVAYAVYRQHRHRMPTTLEATTDALGRFAFRELFERTYQLHGTDSERWAKPRPMAVEAGSRGVQLELGRYRSIEGHIRDEAGRPVSGATVVVRARSGKGGATSVSRTGGGEMLYRSVTANDEGIFEIRKYPPGFKVEITCTPPEARKNELLPSVQGQVEPGGEPVAIVLARAFFISGRVTDQDREPLPGAKLVFRNVRTRDQERVPGRAYRANLADADGRYRLGPLRGDWVGDVMVSGPRVQGRAFSSVHQKDVVAGAKGLDFVVLRLVTLRGVALTEKPRRIRVTFLAEGGHVHRVRRMKPSGAFEIPGLPDARGVLVARHSDGTLFAVREGVRPSDGPFDLETGGLQGTTGQIQGVPGKLYSGKLWAVRGPLRVAGRVAEDGWFDTGPLSPGEWTLTFELAHPKGHIEEAPVKAKAGARGLMLTFIAEK